MATPIKETPILYGKDSDRFLKEVKENEKPENKISQKEYDKAMKDYKEIIKNADI